MDYYFFLSYANDNNDEDEVCQFFDDLSAELCRQLGKKQNTPGIGFRDQDELKTGADWQLEMMTALQASRTLVCLYSPAYFKSRWCGCEWEVFHLRRNLYIESKRQSGEANPLPPHVIKPVIWMQGNVPEVAGGIQIFDFDTNDDIYRKAGLFWLIRRREAYENVYDEFILKLARDILKEKDLSLPFYPFSVKGLLDQVKNPFVGTPVSIEYKENDFSVLSTRAKEIRDKVMLEFSDDERSRILPPEKNLLDYLTYPVLKSELLASMKNIFTNKSKDQANIFICYAIEDAKRIETIYSRLIEAGHQPWIDRNNILPGQHWETAIKKAIKGSDFVLVCLSATSINKRGFIRREIKQALEQAEKMLWDDVYLIPIRLDNCEIPTDLEHLQWVDLFEKNGWEKLLKALDKGLQSRKR